MHSLSLDRLQRGQTKKHYSRAKPRRKSVSHLGGLDLSALIEGKNPPCVQGAWAETNTPVLMCIQFLLVLHHWDDKLM